MAGSKAAKRCVAHRSRVAKRRENHRPHQTRQQRVTNRTSQRYGVYKRAGKARARSSGVAAPDVRAVKVRKAVGSRG